MRIESETVSTQTIARFYNVSGKGLTYQYKEFISDFREWKQLDHAGEYVLFKENIGDHLSIDETCLSQGELYTIITNKEAHGRKGSLVAMIQGTDAAKIIPILRLLPRGKRKKVKEITRDLSPTMKKIATACFPSAVIVSDRFHVQ